MKKNGKMLIGVSSVLLFVIAALVWWFLTQKQPTETVETEAPPALPAKTYEPIKELVVKDLKEGTGQPAKKGQQVQIHYTGWLYDPSAADLKGQKFDSSHDRGDAFKFRAGARQVIPGFDRGIEGLKTGGIRQLIIPADLGYGVRGAGAAIPPNATLLFEIERVD